MLSESKKIFLNIAPSKNQGAILSLLHTYLNHFQIHEANCLEEADFQICHGISKDEVSTPTTSSAYIPMNSSDLIPKALSSKGTPFPAPTALEIKFHKGSFEINFDLLNFLAGQLYRAEEYQSLYRENSFEARSSNFLGERYNTFDIPLVDLWMKWLLEKLVGAPLKTRWQKDKEYALWNTHDVDLLLFWTWKKSLKHILLSPLNMLCQPKNWTQATLSLLKSKFKKIDPFSNLDTLSLLEQKLQIRSTFFVMGWHKDHRTRTYNILRNRFTQAFQKTKDSHDLGLHSSPLHTESSEKLKHEKERVEKALEVDITASRQHYLFWNIRKTPQAQNKIGIQLDSTLGFNNRSGFRCGTAMPFKWYDLENSTELDLIQMPLILADHQMGEDHWLFPEKLYNQAIEYTESIKQVGGVLSLLTHDLYFSDFFQPDMFKQHRKLLLKLSDQATLIQLKDLLPNHE